MNSFSRLKQRLQNIKKSLVDFLDVDATVKVAEEDEKKEGSDRKKIAKAKALFPLSINSRISTYYLEGQVYKAYDRVKESLTSYVSSVGGEGSSSYPEDDANSSSYPEDDADSSSYPENDADSSSYPENDADSSSYPEDDADSSSYPEDDADSTRYLSCASIVLAQNDTNDGNSRNLTAPMMTLIPSTSS